MAGKKLRRPTPQTMFCATNPKKVDYQRKPMTLEQLKEAVDENHQFETTVAIDLFEHLDMNSLMSHLERALVDEKLFENKNYLMDMRWALTGFSPDGFLWLRVAADATPILHDDEWADKGGDMNEQS